MKKNNICLLLQDAGSAALFVHFGAVNRTAEVDRNGMKLSIDEG